MKADTSDEFWSRLRDMCLADGMTTEEFDAMVDTAAENLQHALDNPREWTDEDHKRAAKWVCMHSD